MDVLKLYILIPFIVLILTFLFLGYKGLMNKNTISIFQGNILLLPKITGKKASLYGIIYLVLAAILGFSLLFYF